MQNNFENPEESTKYDESSVKYDPWGKAERIRFVSYETQKMEQEYSSRTDIIKRGIWSHVDSGKIKEMQLVFCSRN